MRPTASRPISTLTGASDGRAEVICSTPDEVLTATVMM